MQPFFESTALRFACTRCGKCCTTGGDYYVFITRQEAERIRDHLGLTPAWFRRRYLATLEGGERVLVSTADERCVFLDDTGQCRIYPVRPVQCRTYPFWPEVAGSRRAWQQEARRCEGIGRGAVVPVGKIRRAVELCKATVE